MCTKIGHISREEVAPESKGQEWTKDGQFGIEVGDNNLIPMCYNTSSRDLLFDAHNASLAKALYDCRDHWLKAMASSLAKERESFQIEKQSWHCTNSMQGEELLQLLQLRSQLAKEREITDPATGETIQKPSWAELGEMNQEVQQLRSQLAEQKHTTKHYRDLFDEVRLAVRPLTLPDATKKQIIDCVKSLVTQLEAATARELHSYDVAKLCRDHLDTARELISSARPIIANAANDPQASPWQKEIRLKILTRFDVALAKIGDK